VVSDRPKALAEINGRPFLDVLVDELLRYGLLRLIFCTGYGGDQIAAYIRDRKNAEVVTSAENRPLGTGGAVVHALPSTRSDPFLVVNGDSFCKVSYPDLLEFHRSRNAMLTIVVTPPSGRGDAGTVQVDGQGRIVAFAEKPAGNGNEVRQVNAGIYVMQREAIGLAPRVDAFSLERELFPAAARSGRCFAFAVPGPLTDIGTPERLKAARKQDF